MIYKLITNNSIMSFDITAEQAFAVESAIEKGDKTIRLILEDSYINKITLNVQNILGVIEQEDITPDVNEALSEIKVADKITISDLYSDVHIGEIPLEEA